MDDPNPTDKPNRLVATAWESLPDEATPADFFAKLCELADDYDAGQELCKEELASRGLGYAETLELMVEADTAEQDAQFALAERDETPPEWAASPAAHRAIRRFWLAGFEPEQIACMLNLTDRQVEAWVELKQYSTRNREVWQGHAAGMSAPEIATALGLRTSDVDNDLRSMGLTPHRKNRRISDETKAEVMRLLAEGLGPTAISKQVEGVTVNDVGNIRRHWRKAS